MGNSFAVIDKASKETLRLFKNNLILGSRVNRQFDKDFVRTPGKIGYTLRVRQPNKFVVRSGATFSANDLADPVSTITVQAQKGVDYLISYADLTMSVEEFTARYTAPAAQHLAAQADLEGYALYKQIANIVGTPGTQPTSTNAAQHMMQANAYITNQAAPIDDRHLITSTQIQVSYIDALKGLLNNQSAIGDQYKKGAFATGILGYDDIAASQSVNTHTAGNYSGTLQVNLAQGAATGATYQSGTLNIKGGANSITGFFKAGDVITIAGCYDVNPLTKTPLPYLKRFAITADANTDGSGNAALTISPAIVYGGAYQTVSAQAANNAAITVLTGAANSTSEQALAFHGDALTFVMAEMEMPTQGVIAASRMTVDDYSFRVIAYYSGDNDQIRLRIDGLWGWACLRPEHACRLAY